MKKNLKMQMIFVLAAAVMFQLTGCIQEAEEEDKEGPTNYKETITVKSQQVWIRDIDDLSPNTAYHRFTGNRDMIVLIRVYNSSDASGLGWKQIDTGAIADGKLSFGIGMPEAGDLMDINDLRTRNLRFWKDVNFSVQGAKYTYFEVDSSVGDRLTRERLVGGKSTLSQEIIQFIYVDADCKITGNPDEFIDATVHPTIWHAEGDLNLSLKAGWNTIFRTETYSDSDDPAIAGKAVVKMRMKNPDNLKWTIYDPSYLN